MTSHKPTGEGVYTFATLCLKALVKQGNYCDRGRVEIKFVWRHYWVTSYMSMSEFGCVSGGLLTSAIEGCVNRMNRSKSLLNCVMELGCDCDLAKSQQWCCPLTVTFSVHSHTRGGSDEVVMPLTVTTLSDRVTPRFRLGEEEVEPVREFR